MRKKSINTILLSNTFFEIAAFSLKKAKLLQQAFASGVLDSGVIKSASQHNKLDFKRDFLAVIPRHQVALKHFKLPSLNAAEIEKMVNFQLQDTLPYRPEDLIIQNSISPSSRGGYSEVSSVVVQKELIEKLLEIARIAKIRISSIDLSSNVLVNRFKALYKRESFLKDNNLLINAEEKNLDFVFIKNGDILLSRGILLNKDNFQEGFIRELKQSLSLFYHRNSKEIKLVFLWGRNNDLRVLRNLIASETHLKTEVNEDENLLKSLAHSLYGEHTTINLVPEFLKDKKKRSLKRKNFIRVAFSFSVILLFLIATLFLDFKEKERHLRLLNTEIKKIEKEATDIQEKEAISKTALSRQAQTLQALDVLAELYSITQPGIFFNSFSLASGKSVLIKGQAEELDKILEFVSKLETSELFQNVELRYTTKRPLRGKEITDFEVAFFVNQSLVGAQR